MTKQFIFKTILFWVYLLSVITVSSLQAQSDFNTDLHALFKEYSEYEKSLLPSLEHSNPEMRKGGFIKVSEAAYRQQAKQYQQFLDRLHQFPLKTLSVSDVVNYKMFEFHLTSLLDWIHFESYLFPMVGDTGFYFDLLRMGQTAHLNNQSEAQFYVEQIEDIPHFLAEWQTNLTLAIQRGKVLPAIVLVDFEKPLMSLVVDSPEKHPLLEPLSSLEKVMDKANAQQLRQRALQAVEREVQPAVNRFIQFLTEQYIPAGRKSIAITDMPGGDEYYQSQIRYYTTLNLTADDIHQIGLKEVARIRAEMEGVIKASGFKGNFAEFVAFLRTDPQFYAKTPKDLLKEAAYIAKKMDGALPRFFTHLPRQPYGIEPVPESIAPRYTTGRYVGAPLDSTRPGLYWVNTYALDKRPLYVLEALTLHEAVPGHHLQSALTKELDNLPEFRRNSYLSAYGEGWALYCEKLGIEAGFYQDYYSQFGRLTYEMWRAIRLVVDTGMHAKGWSREQAIQFMEENTALSKHNVRTEIDRYIAWPAQALSYKMGELKILELRQKAENTLGKAFDLRRFHDEILRHGPVTLPILEAEINRWIEEQQANRS
jgi:uncharacterized protein (DUF885 family)